MNITRKGWDTLSQLQKLAATKTEGVINILSIVYIHNSEGETETSIYEIYDA